jgi:hypothetical protein
MRRSAKEGRQAASRDDFLQVLPNRSTLLPYFVYLFIYIYIYIYIYLFLFFLFFSHTGGQTGANHEKKKNIAGALAFGATRHGWSGLLSGPVTVVPERHAGGDRRTRSRVGVGAGRDSREAATVFFVFCFFSTSEWGQQEKPKGGG